MIYELIHEKNIGSKDKPQLQRLYRNSKTGTETTLNHIYTDDTKVRWWGFNDLYKIPIMRISMTRHITDLYTIGLSLKDIQKWCEQEKAILKSNDPEKYEKLYALILEKEQIATFTADPIKQQLALCTVYILADDERIDYFDEQNAETKLRIWKNFPDMVAFFLTWHTDHIQRYIKALQKVSTTVLNLQEQVNQMKSNPVQSAQSTV